MKSSNFRVMSGDSYLDLSSTFRQSGPVGKAVQALGDPLNSFSNNLKRTSKDYKENGNLKV